MRMFTCPWLFHMAVQFNIISLLFFIDDNYKNALADVLREIVAYALNTCSKRISLSCAVWKGCKASFYASLTSHFFHLWIRYGVDQQVGFTTVPPDSWLHPRSGTHNGSCHYLQVAHPIHTPPICLLFHTHTFSGGVFQHQLWVPLKSTPYHFLEFYPYFFYPRGPNALAPFEIFISWGLK